MNSSLDTYKNSFIACASGLTNYDKLTETELANGYCDALDSHNEILSGQYYAALMVKYWYKIYKYKATCRSTRLGDEDFIGWLEDALNIAFKYRDWRNPSKSIYGDPKAVDKIINRCCYSIKGYYYQEFNKDKRKLNYLTDSIEGQLEKFGDSADANLGFEEEEGWAKDLIVDLIKKGNIGEAIVVDNICYQDSFKDETKSYYAEEVIIKSNKDNEEEKEEEPEEPEEEPEEQEEQEENKPEVVKTKYIITTPVFSRRKLKQSLENLDNKYYLYFMRAYPEVSFENLLSAQSFFNNLTSKEMYKFIDKSLVFIKTALKEIM